MVGGLDESSQAPAVRSDQARVGPLAGVRVIDFSQAVAGPFSGRLLADLGADVIKIEPPTGDLARALTPIGDGEFSAMFNHANAGKRSVVIDLKTSQGLEIARRLVASADVVLENFTPGVMERLGLAYEMLEKLRPGIIMCSVSSFGQYGSYSGYVGADPVGQAMSGMVAMTGDPERTPSLVTNGVADTSTGTHGALAIVAALLQRERTGEGCHLDVSMCDVMLFMDCCNVPVSAATRGAAPMERSGPHNLVVSPYGVFQASGGYVLIEAWGEGEKSLWGRLCRVMGRPELIDDPDYRTNQDRIRNREAVTATIEAWLATLPRDEAMRQLHAARVVAAPVLTPYEALTHTVARDRDMVASVKAGQHDEIDVIANPYRGISWLAPLQAGPLLGADTRTVLSEALGLDSDEISELLDREVVTASEQANEKDIMLPSDRSDDTTERGRHAQ
jgi:CoA:oxalate CoA-transferase